MGKLKKYYKLMTEQTFNELKAVVDAAPNLNTVQLGKALGRSPSTIRSIRLAKDFTDYTRKNRIARGADPDTGKLLESKVVEPGPGIELGVEHGLKNAQAKNRDFFKAMSELTDALGLLTGRIVTLNVNLKNHADFIEHNSKVSEDTVAKLVNATIAIYSLRKAVAGIGEKNGK